MAMYNERDAYNFQETVGTVAQALDRIRYEDGVEYKHAEHAAKLDGIEEDLDDNYQLLQQAEAALDTVSEEDLPADVEEAVGLLGEYAEREGERMGRQQEYFDHFDDVKYDGKTESGPGAFIVLVDGPAETFADYAKEMNGTYWGRNEVDPQVHDENLAQMIYETMEHNDGAIVVGEDGFLPRTYEVPNSDAPEEEYPEKGGTKHRAAVDAVFAGLEDENHEDIAVETLVLSETDGNIRRFRKGCEDDTFPYERESQPRVPTFWEDAQEEQEVPISAGHYMTE